MRARHGSHVPSRRPRSRLKAHYDETQLSCNQATLAHTATLRARLAALVDIERMHQQVKAESDRAAKRALWEELKLASIARTVTAVYALALTHLLMRIATNLVARHLMLEHATNTMLPPGGGGGNEIAGRGEEGHGRGQNGHAAAPRRAGLPVASQLRLLSAADYLVKGPGLARLLGLVHAAVVPACAQLADTEPLDAHKLGVLLEAIRWPLEQEDGAYARLLDCVLPPPDEALAHGAEAAEGSGVGANGRRGARLSGGAECAEGATGAEGAAGADEEEEAEWTDAQLRREVADTIRSSPFAVLVQQTLDGAFSELNQDLAARACPPAPAPEPTGQAAACSPPEARAHPSAPLAAPLPLAKVIPRIANCMATVLEAPSHTSRNAARANRYLHASCRAPSLDEFCFMIYAPQTSEDDAALRAEGEPDTYMRCLPHVTEDLLWGGGGEHNEGDAAVAQ